MDALLSEPVHCQKTRSNKPKQSETKWKEAERRPRIEACSTLAGGSIAFGAGTKKVIGRKINPNKPKKAEAERRPRSWPRESNRIKLNPTEPEFRSWRGWHGQPARPGGPLARRNGRRHPFHAATFYVMRSPHPFRAA